MLHSSFAIEDWVNILEVDEWRGADRSQFRGDRPVIGRHSRDHLSKWPSTPSEILAAYPADAEIHVKILGGADPAISALGYRPPNWTIYPFGAMAPARFLEEIDFFVYYHHPGWMEAFGRNIIEGMASGCPAILPAHFADRFGEHCIYADPGDVREHVMRMHSDPTDYRLWSRRSRDYVEANFGAASHVRRIQELIGPPGAPTRRPPDRRRSPRRALLVSAEPHGIGSVTRLLRVASHLPETMSPVLLAPWPAADLGRQAGVLSELVPDDELGTWDNGRLTDRVLAMARLHRADVILMDASRLTPALRLVVEAAAAPVVRLGIASQASSDAAWPFYSAVSSATLRLPHHPVPAGRRYSSGDGPAKS